MLAGCGGSQPPIGASGAMLQQSARGDSIVGPDGGAEFAYVANYESGNLSGFKIDSDGALTPVKGSPFAAGSGPLSIAVDPDGNFIYVANQRGSYSTISGYTIDPTDGVLTPIKGSPFPSGFNSDAIAIDPAGKFAYVANYGKGSTGYVSAYAISSSSGALEQVKGSPFPAGFYVDCIAVDPTGKFVYAGLNSGFSSYGDLYAYVIHRDSGALTPVKGSPFFAGGDSEGIALDPAGKHLYSVESGISNSAIYGFNVNPNSGALTRLKGKPPLTGTASTEIAIEPSGKFAYITDYYAGKLSAYKISRGGALTQLKGSPFEVGKNTNPMGVAVDPSGKIVYTTDTGHRRVSAFQIEPNGVPIPVKGSPFKAGDGAYSIATCRTISGKCVPPPL